MFGSGVLCGGESYHDIEVLDDGNSAGSGIIAGDSIVALSITKTKDDGTMNVIEERVGVSTEC